MRMYGPDEHYADCLAVMDQFTKVCMTSVVLTHVLTLPYCLSAIVLPPVSAGSIARWKNLYSGSQVTAMCKSRQQMALLLKEHDALEWWSNPSGVQGFSVTCATSEYMCQCLLYKP